MIDAHKHSEVLKQIKELEGRIDENPKDLDAHCKVANLYNDIGDTVEAFSWFRRANRRFPNQVGPYLEMGYIYMSKGDFEEAYDLFDQATKINESDYRAWIAKSKALKKMQAYSECTDSCFQALKVAPDKPAPLKSTLQCMVGANLFEKAEDIIRKLNKSELDIESIAFKDFYEGLMYIKKMLFSDAIAKFETIDVDSEYYPMALHNLALAYSDAKKYDAAEEKFKELMEGTDTRFSAIQKDPYAWINYGLMYEKAKKHKNAYRCYLKANELEKNVWPHVVSLRDIFLKDEDNIEELPDYMLNDDRKEKRNMNKILAKQKLGKLKYAFYLGCVIPNRYPFIERATRLFMDTVGIRLDDMEGATCCPAPGVFRSFDVPTWLTIAARNINIAEQLDDEVVTMCNGCYGTLLEADHILKHDAQKRNDINQHLGKVGRKYEGSSKVRHIVDVLYHDIGKEDLKAFIEKKWDLDVAVHYGCHILKPTETKPWGGEFEDPRFFDEIVELTGCRSLPYKDKMMCCGAGGGLRSTVKEVSLDFTFSKLKNMREVGAQAVITCCPFCHLQFDLGQMEVNNIFKDEIDEPFNYPIIYITQLLNYCMNVDPYEMGLLRPDAPAGTPPFIDTTSVFEKYYEEINYDSRCEL